MPTKVPEYMATGIPVLVLADESTALYKYAKNEEWAFLLSNDNEKVIVDILIEIYNNEYLRDQISQKALEIVQKNHDVIRVRSNFKELLSRALR